MRNLAIAAALLAGAASVQAQAAVTPTEVTVCELTAHPAKYDGKTVRVKGTVQVSFDSFLMRGDSCNSALWLAFPTGTKAKAGPATVVTLALASNGPQVPAPPARPPVSLARDAAFDSFDKLLSEKVKLPGMCLGCVKDDVSATLTGRFDGTDSPGVARDTAGQLTGLDGFGNLNAYGARLVIAQVADVAAKPIDFSAAPKIAGDGPGGSDKDYMGLTRKAAASFPKDSDPVSKINAAVAAYGAPGVDNGVVIAFGDVSGVPAGEGKRAATASPDGLVITATFDPDKLKGDSLSRAIAHDGAEIVAVRDKGTSLSVIENSAWQTTLLTAIGSRQKSLVLPGGTVLWDSTWAQAEQAGKATEALQLFMQDHEQAPR